MHHRAILTSAAVPHLGWNMWQDLRQLLEFHFMVNAFRAAGLAAVIAAVVGWFMVLRRQTFAGHTLATVSFPGAAGAVLLGLAPLWGYFGFCLVAALIVGMGSGAEGRRDLSREGALIGVLQAFALACGFLFVMLYGGFLDETESLLFGTFLGVTDDQVLVLAGVSVGVGLGVALMSRRLFFASVDPAVAASRGVSVRWVGTVFLLALGVAVAEVSQITGALLVFALLVMPPAAAQQLTSSPSLGLLLSVGFGLGVAWLGLALSYFSVFPTGFFITTVGFALYLASWGAAKLLAWARTGQPRPAPAVLE